MTCFAPISGTFPHFGMSLDISWSTKCSLVPYGAARWVDPAFGFAVSTFSQSYVQLGLTGSYLGRMGELQVQTALSGMTNLFWHHQK